LKLFEYSRDSVYFELQCIYVAEDHDMVEILLFPVKR